MPTRLISIRLKQDQAKTGILDSQTQVLGYIIIVHPGHPLVGQTVPVVRRYRERGERLWVIGVADGSRQYVPASWCTPLAPPQNPSRWERSPAEDDLLESSGSPLSLAGLRDLAALVRHLREREATRRKERGDEASNEQRQIFDPNPSDARPRPDERQSGQRPARLGELSSAGSTPPDHLDRPDGPTATFPRNDSGRAFGEEVRSR